MGKSSDHSHPNGFGTGHRKQPNANPVIPSGPICSSIFAGTTLYPIRRTINPRKHLIPIFTCTFSCGDSANEQAREATVAVNGDNSAKEFDDQVVVLTAMLTQERAGIRGHWTHVAENGFMEYRSALVKSWDVVLSFETPYASSADIPGRCYALGGRTKEGSHWHSKISSRISRPNHQGRLCLAGRDQGIAVLMGEYWTLFAAARTIRTESQTSYSAGISASLF